MAKGQQRSNREAKKPKKNRPKVAPALPGSAYRIPGQPPSKHGLRRKRHT